MMDDKLVERVARAIFETTPYASVRWGTVSGDELGETMRKAAQAAIRAIEATRSSEVIELVRGLSELLACSRTGGVHFAVEPERSSVDMTFAKRHEAHAASAILCALHPLDEEGCFIHGQPISEARVTELIELADAYRESRDKALSTPSSENSDGASRLCSPSPDGEVTEEMIEAGVRAEFNSRNLTKGDAMRAIFKAMISARSGG